MAVIEEVQFVQKVTSGSVSTLEVRLETVFKWELKKYPGYEGLQEVYEGNPSAAAKCPKLIQGIKLGAACGYENGRDEAKLFWNILMEVCEDSATDLFVKTNASRISWYNVPATHISIRGKDVSAQDFEITITAADEAALLERYNKLGSFLTNNGFAKVGGAVERVEPGKKDYSMNCSPPWVEFVKTSAQSFKRADVPF